MPAIENNRKGFFSNKSIVLNIMSSIFGILQSDTSVVQKNAFDLMFKAADHWGADSRNSWSDGPVALGHLMLYNTPESLSELLPRYFPEEQLTITADARIDNRDELFTKLPLTANEQRQISDSELIVKAYQKYKEACVEHLIGDFAFAIWDIRSQKLFCARDHLGIRPLFYYHHNGIFLFSSEKKAILAVPEVDKTINKQFFVNQIHHTPEQEIDTTLYKYIQRLAPAHTLVVNVTDGSVAIRQYWELNAFAEAPEASLDYFCEGILNRFEEAVKCRSRSAFTIASELSGGLDSSAITGAMAKFCREAGTRFETISNTLPPGVSSKWLLLKDEKKHFEQVISFNAIEHANYVTENPFLKSLDEIDFFLEVNDGPEMWNPLFMVGSKKKAAERGIRTILSGFGGDQVVSSLHKYAYLSHLDEKKYLDYFRDVKRSGNIWNGIRPFVPFKVYQWFRDHLYWFGSTHKKRAEFYRQINIPAPYRKSFRRLNIHYKPYVEQFKSYRHFEKYRVCEPGVSLRAESENRYGYYFKHDCRYPLLDIRLLQFYISIPNKFKFHHEMNRFLFRRAVKKYLPPGIYNRQDKIGGVAPYFYLRDQPYIEETIASANRLPDTKMINKSLIVRNADRIKNYRREHSFDNSRSTFLPHGIVVPPVEVLRWVEKNSFILEDLLH